MRFASFAAMGMVGTAAALPRFPQGFPGGNYASKHHGSSPVSSHFGGNPSSIPYAPPPVASQTGAAAGLSQEGAGAAPTAPVIPTETAVAASPVVPTQSVAGVTPATTAPASGGANVDGDSPHGQAFDQAVKIFLSHYSASPTNQAQLVEDNQNIANALQNSVANNGPHGAPPHNGASDAGAPPPAVTSPAAVGAETTAPPAGDGVPPPVATSAAVGAENSPPAVFQDPASSVPVIPTSTGAAAQVTGAPNSGGGHWALSSGRGINPSTSPIADAAAATASPAVDQAGAYASPSVNGAAATASPAVDAAAAYASPSASSAAVSGSSVNPFEN